MASRLRTLIAEIWSLLCIFYDVYRCLFLYRLSPFWLFSVNSFKNFVIVFWKCLIVPQCNQYLAQYLFSHFKEVVEIVSLKRYNYFNIFQRRTLNNQTKNQNKTLKLSCKTKRCEKITQTKRDAHFHFFWSEINKNTLLKEWNYPLPRTEWSMPLRCREWNISLR